jgi:hypothetical protein
MGASLKLRFFTSLAMPTTTSQRSQLLPREYCLEVQWFKEEPITVTAPPEGDGRLISSSPHAKDVHRVQRWVGNPHCLRTSPAAVRALTVRDTCLILAQHFSMRLRSGG